jgi:isovaleryl-CoA dehydrogenase
MRGSNTGELVFEECRVPRESLVGREGDGAGILMSGLDYERLVLSAGPVGIMRAVLDCTLPYVTQRCQFGQPISSFQLVQGQLADLYVAWASSRALMYQTARHLDHTRKYDDRQNCSDDRRQDCTDAHAQIDRNDDHQNRKDVNDAQDGGEEREYGARRRDCAASILYAAECATVSALKGIQLLGGNGYINEYDVGRLLRDAKLYEIGAGTSEIRRLIIARELLRQHQ